MSWIWYKYKDIFSLRDEIGICPNVEVEIDVTDKSPFFIRPYHVKEEDKNILDKEMKRLHYFGILNKGFSAYLSPVMLISRNVMKDKGVVTDFRHLNTSIAKYNLAYLLLKDTVWVLGIIGFRFKRCIPFFKSFKETQKDTVESCHTLVALHIYLKECLWDWIYLNQFSNHI